MKKRPQSSSSKAVITDPEQLIVDVAIYYYEQKLTQEKIARLINASRSTVSRLLDEARDKGIVQIQINYPWRRDHNLEEQLVSRFGLLDAQVLITKDKSEDEIGKGTGVLAARLIDTHVRKGQIIGLSYGQSLARTMAALAPSRQLDLTVVPVIGALGSSNPAIDGADLVRHFAQVYGAEYRYLPVPLLVEDIRTRDALIQVPQVYETLNLARKANIVLLGIGAPSPEVLSGIWKGYMDERELRRLKAQGAAGHMCGQFFDANGQLMDIEVNQRSIGIGIKALTNVDFVIAVASGKRKAAAILGALRGEYLNILVTDDAAASAVLALDETSAVDNRPPAKGHK